MTPLILITGFLGSGKTSLLRQVLPGLADRGIDSHVFLNDYRNAWIDARTLEGLAGNIFPIHGSCICCGSRDELMKALETTGLRPRSVALVEANGTADAIEVVEMLTADKRVGRYSLPVQVAVIDAKRWQKRHWNNEIEELQARGASFLVMTRRDEVTAERCAEVEAQIAKCSPNAQWIDAAELVTRLVRMVDEAATVPPRRFDATPRRTENQNHARHHFASMEMKLREVVDSDNLREFLRSLPAEVIRAKGVAVIDGFPPESVLFQKVEGRDEPVLMRLGTAEGVEPVMVLIGAAISEDDIFRIARRLGLY